jgi:hypothetical protein
MVNGRYGKLVSDVKIWREHFPAFAQHLRGMGFPFENGVMFVDGTLKETCRSGGWVPLVSASLHHVCENICDLLSLFLFSFSVERRRRMYLCQYERLPSVSKGKTGNRLKKTCLHLFPFLFSSHRTHFFFKERGERTSRFTISLGKEGKGTCHGES